MTNTDYDALVVLALDLRWSWNHGADELWKRIDPDLWDATENPWLILRTASRRRIERFLAQPDFRTRLRALLAEQKAAAEVPKWFPTAHADSGLSGVAYFSMEYMLSEALPIYSGGLGNVAGDQLKAAADLGVPVVAVGLLYAQGYFRQEITQDGSQGALYPTNNPDQLPISPVRDADGEWLRLEVSLPGRTIWIRAWEAQVSTAKLYLLDTNDPANPPAVRCITSELYGGGPELRLRQELVLGIGGWRLLRALGLTPDVCHLNEGHAAFAALERAACVMEELHVPFEQALTIIRPGTVFTTHTAVEAGFDRFAPELIARYLRTYAEERLGVPLETLLALGRPDPADVDEPFNMAYLAIRVSGAINAVSQLHGQVSRRLFQNLFPRWPEHEIPVRHVTNGIHVPTWDSAAADTVWTEAAGKERWLSPGDDLDRHIRALNDARLWQLRTDARSKLVAHIRAEQGRREAGGDVLVAGATDVAAGFDPNVLTLGFARRFATYKRPNLLLSDPERLVRILGNAERPVQLVLAGKAHPQDGGGQALIRQWIAFAQRPDVRGRVIFLPDYDMRLAQRLVQGADLWVNTPLRPWEASGTSGMKVLVNGGLNLSELDGWWAEAYAPEVGWAIGDGQEHGDDPGLDAQEAETLYRLLEQEIVPEFYDRDDNGIPAAWVGRVRESMARLTPLFSAARTVRDYTERFYLPAAAAYLDRVAEGGKLSAEILDWQKAIASQWHQIRLGKLQTTHFDGEYRISVEVFLGDLDPKAVRVELYADATSGALPTVDIMADAGTAPGAKGQHFFTATVSAARPVDDYTPRVVPSHPRAWVPLEAPAICWQR